MLPLYDAILHLDDDALVVQLDRPIESFLDGYPDKDDPEVHFPNIYPASRRLFRFSGLAAFRRRAARL